MAWFSTFQFTTTCRNRPISPPWRIARARCQVASSGKLKSIIPGTPAERARSSIDFGTREIGGQGLFDKDRLAAIKGAKRDFGLQIGRDGNRDRVDRRVIDQGAPVTDAARNTGRARQLGCPARIGAGERDHLAARIGPKRRQDDGAAIVAADDADADHR